MLQFAVNFTTTVIVHHAFYTSWLMSGQNKNVKLANSQQKYPRRLV
uniref:Uncharacterized protein n=1 Tax=Ciona intestinalis TaxID=7719 RepID=H2XNV8_CIOIN